MSDGNSKKWEVVDASLQQVLLDTPSVKAMSKEDWHKFLRTVKEDSQGATGMHKLIEAGGDNNKSQFHGFATSRLGKLRETPQYS